ncbi:CidA/LrgA family holin-like protein [Oceanobacillus luteolus]|uniref:CidA/LrgA family protein n=1 Tax=Oceanobacillus luteolus TaxID=1274358 RepID=A0ABW4HTX6_9BACI|nr:CidA/LrgA family holin-like protein [Oceanobacillus luteolus]MCM3741831.1 CidA/LrgA family holin-like protein [Oceanobacillus luteolus]
MWNIFKIILHIIFLYSIYRIGDWIQNAFDLIIPGSVIGMIILFVLLSTDLIKVVWIEEGSKFVVNNLVLFFIPATVGLINYLDFFAGRGFLLVLIVLFCTVLVIASSGATSQWIMYRKEKQHD